MERDTEPEVFTKNRLERLHESLSRIQKETLKLFGLWNEIRGQLSENFRVTHFFSNIIHRQIQCVNVLFEKGFASCTPPLFRIILENMVRMVYYERVVSEKEKTAFLTEGHTAKLREFRKCLGKVKKCKRFTPVQIAYIEGLWENLSSYVHGNIERVKGHADDAGIIGVNFPLSWILWELETSSGNMQISVDTAVISLALHLRTLLNEAQLLNLITSGHYAEVDPAIGNNTELASEFVNAYRNLLILHQENRDLYSAPIGSRLAS